MITGLLAMILGVLIWTAAFVIYLLERILKAVENGA